MSIAAVAVAMSCTADPTAPDPPAGQRPPERQDVPDVQRGVRVRIVSVASVPDAGRAGAWHFDADQDVFDLRVTLEGEGTFELAAELLATDGRSIARHARTVELDGRQDVDLSGFAMPEPDGYRLMVEVSGPGVRSRQDVSVRRG